MLFMPIWIVVGNVKPAMAEWTALPTAIISLQDSPLYISEVVAYRTDDHGETLACVGFVNVGLQEARAVKFMVFESDAFDEVLRHDTLTIEGRFSPNIQIKVLRAVNGVPRNAERCYDTSMSNSKTQKIIVRLEQVLWQDGTVWTSPTAGAPEVRSKVRGS